MNADAVAFYIMQILLVMTALAWWLFCAWYWVVSRWWEKRYSRNLMAVGAAIGALYTLLVIYIWIDRWYMWMSIAASLILLGSLAAVIERTYLMDKVQRQKDE